MKTTVEDVDLGLLKERLTLRMNQQKLLSPVERRRAVRQIMNGVRFSIKKGLDLTVGKRFHFDIHSFDSCILGLNCGSYQQGCRSFKIRQKEARQMGFFPLRASMPVETWQKVYNRGWREVGVFFGNN